MQNRRFPIFFVILQGEVVFLSNGSNIFSNIKF